MFTAPGPSIDCLHALPELSLAGSATGQDNPKESQACCSVSDAIHLRMALAPGMASESSSCRRQIEHAHIDWTLILSKRPEYQQ